VTDFQDLTSRLRQFAAERDWERYHDPKNLAMAVASEAGELLAELRWLTTEQSSPEALSAAQRQAISHEMADVLIFLLRMADVLEIDLPSATIEKIDINESRFNRAES
jgi:NTP pyrophosphatase (non-canonical NTP hydrolase)